MCIRDSVTISHSMVIGFTTALICNFSIVWIKKSKYINQVDVSTESVKIKKVAQRFGASVPFMRPKNLAKSN